MTTQPCGRRITDDHRAGRRGRSRPPAAGHGRSRPGPPRSPPSSTPATTPCSTGCTSRPDLDTVTYTLADAINPDDRLGSGRRDLAGDGVSSSGWAGSPGSASATGTWPPTATAPSVWRGRHARRRSPASWPGPGVSAVSCPVTDDPVRTRLQLVDGPEVGFQEYFVRPSPRRGRGRVRFEGARAPARTRRARGAGRADTVVVCPSNPVVSIDPLLAVPGVLDARAPPAPTSWRVSPIVAGAALKGPADRLLARAGPRVVGGRCGQVVRRRGSAPW